MESADNNPPANPLPRHAAFSGSMLVVSTGILLSKILGFVRDIVLAGIWGTSLEMAAFVNAFTIPNLLRSLFGEGTFSAAFVPVFSERLEKEGSAAAWKAACRVVSVLALVLGAVVLGIMVLSLLLLPWIKHPLMRRTLELVPWLMPYGLLVCVAGAFGMALNSLKQFVVPALTPLLLNLLIIVAVLVPVWIGGRASLTSITILVPAILVAGALHLLFHLEVFRRQGFLFRWEPDFKAPEVGKMAGLMAPAIIGTSVVQLNIIVDRLLATLLGPDATSALYYSQRLIYIPVGLFGVASGVVCLPAMSRAYARGDLGEITTQLRHALLNMIFLTLPVVGLLAVLGIPLIRLCFERGSFTDQSTLATFQAFFYYLPGIPAFAAVKVTTTAFYSRQDTRTPVRIAYVCLALNVVLNLILMQPLRQGGLALATSICSAVNLGLLFYFLRKALGPLGFRENLPAYVKIAVATALSMLAAWLMLRLTAGSSYGTVFLRRLMQIALPIAAGSLVYLGAAVLLRCGELQDLLAGIRERLERRFRRKSGN